MHHPSRQKTTFVLSILVSGCFLAGCGADGTITSAAQPPAATRTSGQEASKRGAPRAAEQRANRLAKETSPYLLMHAHNPVDWFPWGPEALEKAKREGKVIFLSVGYSSCHWCHVMERESFMDQEIAALLNAHFVCIKVDREERPDVDAIYMKSVHIFGQLSGGGARGGWPMSVFLTPDTEPFFAGTYFPARDGDRGARMGFLSLVQRIQKFWLERPEDLKRDAATITRLVKNEFAGQRAAPQAQLDRSVPAKTFASLRERFDPQHAGFGFDESNPMYPKFPEPSNLLFLIYWQQAAGVTDEDQAQARAMLVDTLERMAMGGIRDHLGGGFHRYSVDRFWRIPHFEKMLYDNGQLATVYAEAYQATGREDFRRVVEELLEFVLREMTAPEGGFYSALDAESEHEEGKFYRWDKEEAERLLAGSSAELFSEVYGLDQPPNFEGKYFALQLTTPLSQLAAARDYGEDELHELLAPLRRQLFEVRSQRPRPLTDTKILTSWNGLMIRGFADAGRVLKSAEYVSAAETAADFVLDKLRNDQGGLLRTYGNGVAKLNAYLDDYAFLVDGLIALHRATDDEKWLAAADQLTQKQLELYWDEQDGGFFFTSGDHESLIARTRDPVDGAEPSGNSVAAQNLIYLGRALEKPEYLVKAERALHSVSELLERAPAAAPRMAIALDLWLRENE